jgi:hypothetical protein
MKSFVMQFDILPPVSPHVCLKKLEGLGVGLKADDPGSRIEALEKQNTHTDVTAGVEN